MPTPSRRRRLARASVRTLQVVVYTLLFSAVVFFGLTRTEVGRGELRRQIEAQFNERFAGSLQIGHLRGNLVNDLFASDVQVMDPQGRVLASVDSVVARPRWTSLLGGTLSIRSVTLIRPHLALHRDAAGAWNAVATFQSIRETPADRQPLDVTLADVRVTGGSVATINHGDVPRLVAENWLFNYADAVAQDLEAHATIEWTQGERLVEVYDVSLSVPDADLQVSGLQAQLVKQAGAWSLNQVEVETPGSQLRGSGSLEAAGSRAYGESDGDAEPTIDVDLAPSRIDNAEFRRLFPRLPLAGTTRLEGRVSGAVSSLVVDRLALAYGGSQVRLSGTLLGLPDSVDVETRVDGSRLRVRDLRSVWPSADFGAVAPIREVALDGYVEGTVQWQDLDRPSFRVRSSIEAASPVGAVAGSLSVRRAPGEIPTYTASLQTDSLDPGTILRRPALESRLNGRVWLTGRGFRRDSTLRARTDVQLRSSIVAGQRLDSLSFNADVDGRTFESTLDVTQPGGGRFRGRGRLDATAATPVYRFALASLGFDLGRWPVDLPTTRLNGVATVQGRGLTWDDLAGTLSLRVDTSAIMRGDSTTVLPPHWSTLHLAERGSGRPRLELYGSVGSMTVEGEAPGPPLLDLGRLWATALRDAVRREIDKPYPRSPESAPPSTSALPPASPLSTSPALASRETPGGSPVSLASLPLSAPDDPSPADVSAASDSSAGRSPAPVDLGPLRDRARTSLRRAGYDGPLTLRGALQIDQPEVVRAWWPKAPGFDTAVQARSSLTIGPDTLSLEGDFEAANLRGAPSSLSGTVSGLGVTFRASASLNAPLAETLDGRMDVQADSVRARNRTIAAPLLSVEYTRRRGLLRLSTGADSSAAPPAAAGLGPSPAKTRSSAPATPETRASSTITKPGPSRAWASGAPFRLTAGLDVRPDRNVLTIRRLYASTGDLTWRNTEPGQINLYADAAVIDSFALESPRPSASTPQRVQVHGTLSGTPTDTVFVETSEVLLHPIFAAAGSGRPIGGIADGTVAFTGGIAAPDASGGFTVRRLSFDRRLLGQLRISTRYTSGSPNLRLDAEITPETMPLDSLRARYPALVPGGLQRSEANALRLSGTVGIPFLQEEEDAETMTMTTSASSLSPRLDLRLDVDRADLFFFEYIFEEELARVSGYTAGGGTITGRLTDPTFNADMIVREGRFSLPDFGLRYRIAGTVKVDREGFHLRDVEVADDEGSALIEGAILFNEYRFFSFDLRGELDEAEIIDVSESQELPFYGNIRASATATLTGPLSDAKLTSEAARTTPESELFIPVSEGDVDADSGYIIFADSTGRLPNIRDLTQRDNILSDRPAGEPTFIDGLEIDVNVIAPEGSTVHLVFDPLVGDVVTAVGSGRVQLQQQEGEFLTYGQFNVTGGDYLFTAGEVFVRRFSIGDGTITWDGDPINAKLDIDAAYRTRASTRGLPGESENPGRIPVVVNLDITGRVETPQVDLSLALARDDRGQLVGTRTLDAILNQSDAATEYATSVLLTNTFLLTTGSATQGTAETPGGENRLATAGNQLAFNSVSQLVASQLNRYLSAALPNVDVNFGLQGENPEDLDVIYGVALRLLDERLIIRGEGVYTGEDTEDTRAAASGGPQGEFVVEVRLSRRVSAEVFFRRQGDDVAREALTQTAGVGVSYQSEFSTWRQLYVRLFGWLGAGDDEDDDAPADTTDDAIARRPE